jgi:hypothetical protein
MDVWSPAWGFAAVGGVGALVTLAVLPGELRRLTSARPERTEAGRGPGTDPTSVPPPEASRAASQAV